MWVISGTVRWGEWVGIVVRLGDCSMGWMGRGCRSDGVDGGGHVDALVDYPTSGEHTIFIDEM